VCLSYYIYLRINGDQFLFILILKLVISVVIRAQMLIIGAHRQRNVFKTKEAATTIVEYAAVVEDCAVQVVDIAAVVVDYALEVVDYAA